VRAAGAPAGNRWPSPTIGCMGARRRTGPMHA
jgi:hypothetical protein